MDLGITLFDTADVYGAGHGEEVLGRAIAGRRDHLIVATKFGKKFDSQSKNRLEEDASPEYIRQACEASLRRLNTDVIDLYQFHNGAHDPDMAVEVRDVLEELVAAGKIRYYGWSTDSPEAARVFADGPHCTAIQQRLSLFEGSAETLAVCEQYDMASINRGPLAQGLLTGKFTAGSKFPKDDLRHKWDFTEGREADRLGNLEKIRGTLTSDGRTPAQGALGWLWAASSVTIPIPGFKTVKQVEENADASRFGPLSTEQMCKIDDLLGRQAQT